MKNKKIKFPIDEDVKQRLRDRLEEVMSRTTGQQVIIIIDKDKISDYFQNASIADVLEKIKSSAIDYAKVSDDKYRGHLLTNDIDIPKINYFKRHD